MTDEEKDNLSTMLAASKDDYVLAVALIKNNLVYKEKPEVLYDIVLKAVNKLQFRPSHEVGAHTKMLFRLVRHLNDRFNLGKNDKG
jgi:hypothetical protein